VSDCDDIGDFGQPHKRFALNVDRRSSSLSG